MFQAYKTQIQFSNLNLNISTFQYHYQSLESWKNRRQNSFQALQRRASRTDLQFRPHPQKKLGHTNEHSTPGLSKSAVKHFRPSDILFMSRRKMPIDLSHKPSDGGWQPGGIRWCLRVFHPELSTYGDFFDAVWWRILIKKMSESVDNCIVGMNGHFHNCEWHVLGPYAHYNCNKLFVFIVNYSIIFFFWGIFTTFIFKKWMHYFYLYLWINMQYFSWKVRMIIH